MWIRQVTWMLKLAFCVRCFHGTNLTKKLKIWMYLYHILLLTINISNGYDHLATKPSSHQRNRHQEVGRFLAQLFFKLINPSPSLPACRRLLIPLLHAAACNKGNRRRLHAENVHHCHPYSNRQQGTVSVPKYTVALNNENGHNF